MILIAKKSRINLIFTLLLITILICSIILVGATSSDFSIYPVDEQEVTTKSEDFGISPINEQEISPEISKKIHKELKEKLNEKIQVIIQLKNENKKSIEDKIKLRKGNLKESLDNRLIMAEISSEDLNEIADDVNIEKIWPDRETKVVLDESVNQINAPYLWDLNYTGKNIKIAVLDTGVSNHDMLQDRISLQRDFTGSNDPNDYNGHGTHVAGIIAGSDEIGQYKGVAYDALILNGKVLNNDGSGQLSWLINGIDWAINNGADIISLSLGATYNGEPEDLLSAPEILKVEEAVSKGVIVVIASGNCNNGCGSFKGVTTPGIAKNSITVGAVDDNNQHASFSSGDMISDYIKPDVVAPGVNICSSFINNDYSCLSGTSMSTPHIAGATALLLEKDSLLSPLQIKSIFENNALDLGVNGKDVEYGSGLVDLSKLEESPVEPIIENNYVLKIPLFEVGKKDEIVLSYENIFENYKKFKFVFNLEDLDELNTEEFKETIPYGKTKEVRYKWHSSLVGKHLLTIDVYSGDKLLQHIESVVSVAGSYNDNMANVRILLR